MRISLPSLFSSKCPFLLSSLLSVPSSFYNLSFQISPSYSVYLSSSSIVLLHWPFISFDLLSLSVSLLCRDFPLTHPHTHATSHARRVAYHLQRLLPSLFFLLFLLLIFCFFAFLQVLLLLSASSSFLFFFLSFSSFVLSPWNSIIFSFTHPSRSKGKMANRQREETASTSLDVQMEGGEPQPAPPPSSQEKEEDFSPPVNGLPQGLTTEEISEMMKNLQKEQEKKKSAETQQERRRDSSCCVGIDLGAQNTVIASSIFSSPFSVSVDVNALANRSTPSTEAFDGKLR